MNFNLIGSFFGSDGYSNHLKGLANALSKIAKVRITTNIIPNWEKLVTDKELEMLKTEPSEDEINIIITPPISWRLSLGKRNWAYCIWEGDKIPDSFIEEFLNPEIEYILIPSKHILEAIQNTIKRRNTEYELASKINIIPHGVNLDLFYPKKTDKKKFTFLCNKGFRNSEDRGGIQYAIKAFCEEFNKNENVELIIKINPAYGIPDLNKLIKELNIQNKEIATIKFITNYIEYNKLIDLYNSADVFVSPTRAEAFNIPCLEAMACGLPIITTNFGGQTDFCNEFNSWIISGELKDVEHEIQYEGIKWLTPNLDELRRAMRTAYKYPDLIKEKGSNGLKTAIKFTWDNSAQEIIKLAGLTKKA